MVISSVVAGALLGISGDVVAVLVKLGLMQGQFVNRVGKIQLFDLVAFSDQYILGREGNFLLGRRGFSRRMRVAGLEPVAVVKQHGVWLRKRVEVILKAGVATSAEAGMLTKKLCVTGKEPTSAKRETSCRKTSGTSERLLPS